MKITLTEEEYSQGYEKCALLVKHHTGWDLHEADYNYPKKALMSDKLMSDNTLTAKDVALQHYYKEAVSFGFNHSEALDYAKSNLSPNDTRCVMLKLND